MKEITKEIEMLIAQEVSNGQNCGEFTTEDGDTVTWDLIINIE